jgi:aspartate/methionine/tyrosine aminotransferase
MESIKTKRIPYSEIRVMFDAAKELERQGKEIIHLEIGRPDFNTPGHIVEAAIKALREGKHHYSQNAGILELREAVADKFVDEYKLDYVAKSEVVITNGVAEAVYVAVNALLNPGDQILIPDPAWVNYLPVAYTNYVEPVMYTLNEENNFQPDPEEIGEKITPRTKMMVIISPSNPTGGVLRRNILDKIASLAEKHGFLILSDEIYEKVIYPPAEHTCIATLDNMKDKTLVLNGFSKFYSMTGWRLGYVLGPEELINPILRYHQYMITSANTFAQWGAVAALKNDQSPSYAMVEEFKKRRDYFYKAIAKIPGFACSQPDGAFYLFPSVEGTGMDGHQMAKFLLEEAGVAAVAGGSFGKNGRNNIRFSYANSMANLKKAVTKIEKAMNERSLS